MSRSLFARTPVPVAAVLWAGLTVATSLAASGSDDRNAIVNRFAADFERRYVFADRGRAAAVHIRRRLAAHAYDDLREQALARAVTADVDDVVHDKHVHFGFNVYPLPPQNDPSAEPSKAERQAARMRAAAQRYGFGTVSMLRGGVGYVELRGFMPAEFTGPAMARAMSSIAAAGAIIIDERSNAGGDPATVAMLASYFFPRGSHVHLDDLQLRIGERKNVLALFTSDVRGPRFPKAPLYVLTSAGTFSAAEAFAYEMQALKRATIVGQTTRGGANGGAQYHYGEHYYAFIPIARAINPITHGNWEGVGVRPDVVATNETFKSAYLAALRKDLDVASADKRTSSIEWITAVEQTDPRTLAQQLHVPSFMPPPGWITHGSKTRSSRSRRS